MTDKEMFTWIPFYEEFADILLGYRDRQGELIEFLEGLKNEGLTIPSLQDKNSQGEASLLAEIDPFTFYGAFNRGIKEGARIAIAKAIKERFQVKAGAPEDFYAVPRLNAMTSWFFPFASMREKDHIEKLWHLYELALDKDPLNNNEFADVFNEVIVLPQIRFNITMGLFWIRPKIFLNLDETVRRYLRHRYPGIPWKSLWRGLNFEKYKEACEKVRENDGRPSFHAISHDAFLYIREQGKDTKEKGAKAPSAGKRASDIPLNSILYGPPGTGKTYHTINEAVKILDRDFYDENKEDREQIQERFEELKEEEHRVDFVTFHQSFSYEEFIEGLKAEAKDGQVFFKVEDGLFKKLCARAQGGRRGLSFEEELEPCLLIIDEINRGNISAIFGELITLIEPSKRIGSDDELSAVLPYSREYFGIPANLYIIGTMNTADRSIALLDTALRRRFRFVEMMPNYELLEGVEVDGVQIPRLLRTINRRIEALYDRDHQIGHTCFLSLRNNPAMEKLADIFRYSILPLLQEYFYDNWEKINLVFNNNRFVIEKEFPDIPSNELIDSEKKIWRIAERKVFGEADNYKRIYDEKNDDE